MAQPNVHAQAALSSLMDRIASATGTDAADGKLNDEEARTWLEPLTYDQLMLVQGAAIALREVANSVRMDNLKEK